MPENEDLYTTHDHTKRLLRHYVKDKEQIVIRRREFTMTRHPDSTEDVEIIQIDAIAEESK